MGYFVSQVFEDACNGIVCYKDENGDIVCEGYDEGPRYEPQIPRPSYHPRWILFPFQQSWYFRVIYLQLFLVTDHFHCLTKCRDAEIMDILQQNWLRIVNGEDINDSKRSVLDKKEDFNANNGSNSFL